jgi:hypothetical protein
LKSTEAVVEELPDSLDADTGGIARLVEVRFLDCNSNRRCVDFPTHINLNSPQISKTRTILDDSTQGEPGHEKSFLGFAVRYNRECSDLSNHD